MPHCCSTLRGNATLLRQEPPPRSATRRLLPLDDVGGPPTAEVADVDALGPADPGPPYQRVVHMTEQDEVRLRLPDRFEQSNAAPLHPPRLDVVEQLRDVRRDVRAQHVDAAQPCDLRGVLVVVDLVRRPHRRAQTTADEAEPPTPDDRGLAVEDGDAVPD